MILVTGATGLVGRPLVTALAADGRAVRAVTRAPATAALPDGIEIVHGDPSRPSTLADALKGVTALFLHPRAAGEAAAELVALARDRGVRRVVALSALNIDENPDDQPSRHRGDRNKEAEQAVTASGLEWASLRSGTFAASGLHAWGAQIRAGDVVHGPYPEFSEAPIHEQDLADVAARALITDRPLGRLELTGPHALTHARMIEVIGGVLGRPLTYRGVPPEAAAEALLRQGVAAPFVAALLARYRRELGRPAVVTDTVQRVLGRPAHDYATWVADHADAFAAPPTTAGFTPPSR
ncbi:NAD(P)H-binding protein [Kitasatospora sp. NPDC101447]|uniref:NAD(P)H-binding protein n=1 Tax=Kitasatospora sp. NPDC101447 TaxID=3364102 RepID=UPI00381377C9